MEKIEYIEKSSEVCTSPTERKLDEIVDVLNELINEHNRT